MVQINQQLNPNLKQYQQQLTGAGANQLQNTATDTISQGIGNNPVVKNFAPEGKKDTWMLPALFVPLFAAVSYGMNKFNEACRGKYEESLVGKLAVWGDKVGKNKFFQSPFMKGIEKALGSTKDFIKTKIIKNSKTLTALFKTPAQPTVKMVLLQGKGTIAEIAAAATQDFAEYTKKGTVNLKELGISKEVYEDLIANPHTNANIKRIMNICEKQGNVTFKKARGFSMPWKNGKHITEVLPYEWVKKMFGEKTVHFSEHFNKLKALSGKSEHWLGNFLPKALIRGLESLTFGNTGGIIGVGMAVGFLASALKDAIKAPKGEKGKTFAERNIYNMGFYLTMPLAINAMYHAGGLQYIGMSPRQVAEYRKALKTFNDDAKAFKMSETQYKDRLKNLKDMLKVDLKAPKNAGFVKKTLTFFKNIVRRPLKWAGKLLMVGSEMPEAYIKEGATGFSKFFSKIGYGFKNGAGYPVRFIVCMLAIAPPLANLCAKASHLVFGRPTKSVLDKEKPEEKPAVAAQKAVANVKPLQQSSMPKAVTPVSGNNTNLLNNYKTSPQTPLVSQPQAVQPQPKIVRTYVPSSEGFQSPAAQPQEPVRTYVPQSDAVKVQADFSKRDENNQPVLDQSTPEYQKTVKAEQDALKFLSGK